MPGWFRVSNVWWLGHDDELMFKYLQTSLRKVDSFNESFCNRCRVFGASPDRLTDTRCTVPDTINLTNGVRTLENGSTVNSAENRIDIRRIAQ